MTDDNSCIYTNTFTINQPTAGITVSANTTDVSCNGGNDGTAVLTLSGGTGTLSVDWGGNNPTALTAGIYSYTITDSVGCSYTNNITINEPNSISTIPTINNVSCFGLSDGSVTLAIAGGTPTYTEDWGTNNPLSLSAETYNYTITDNNGCTYSDSITITEPQELIAIANINNVLCKDENNGSVTLNISGGTNPYFENWGTFNPNALYAGTYTYTIADNNGCLFSNQVNITEPDLLLSTISTTDAICNGYNDGSAIINNTGGTIPYTIDWFGENNMALYSGNYSVLITDGNGCTNTLNFTIDEPTGITYIIDSFPTSCFGYSDGSVTLTIFGGSPPYIQDWGSQNPLSLSAGNHTFTITDNNNCVQQGIATIYEPDEIAVNEIISDVLCNGENNGTAFLQISGGTSPYTEDWNGINILQLSKGNYNYTITDANGCIFSDYVIIDEPNILTVSENVTDANCFNSNDGQVILIINGGTEPYNEDWGIENPFSLSAGTYNYIVTDANGCNYTDTVIINQSNQVTMDFNLESPICIYDSSAISISVTNPLSSYYTVEINDGTITSYILIDSLGNDFTNGQSIKFIPLNSVLFTVISITDENGCNSPVNQIDSIIVNPLPSLSLDIPNFCTQDSSIYLDQGLPIGGIYMIDGIQTNLFDIDNLEVETYNIRYEYTDPITGCSNDISTEIQINESPIAEFEFGPKPVNIDEPEVEFINRSYNYNYLNWKISDGGTVNGEEQFIHTFEEIGEYTTKLYVQNDQGCADSISYKIIIDPVFNMYIPSAFSPNKDGVNESFGPILREKGYTSYSIQIFNQWGQLIFDEENTFWDGKINGKLCQNGTYSYTITAYDFLNKPHSRTGQIMLIR